MNIKWVGAHSNNFGVSRNGNSVNKIILHWIVGTLESADATFNKSTRKASAHYGVGNNEIHQYVKEDDTAWHAGNLQVNMESIGIEHEGGPDLPITEQTVKTSISLVTDICKRYNIPADSKHIKRHSDIKATQCPGTLPVERIIQEVKKNLEPVDDDLTRAVLLLKDFKDKYGHGNYEGSMNALVGAFKDNETLKKNIEDANNAIRDRDSYIQGQKKTIDEQKEQMKKIAEMLKVENDYPTIKGEIEKLIEVETNLDVMTTKYKNCQSKLKDQGIPEKSILQKILDWIF